MKTRNLTRAVALLVLLVASYVDAGPLPGAIFTTMPDGDVVNGNIYTNQLDVYLDGGPGPNAPARAAGLPEGDYYFQVTDPSGKKLLSLDPVASRRVHVNTNGVIDEVYAAPTVTQVRGKNKADWGTHAQGIDIDHSELGAITVQLMPYKKTPNKGGVYKAWMTPVEQFVGDPAVVDNGYGRGYYHGFIPAWSKTDNYKVQIGEGGGGNPQKSWFHSLYVFKFADLDADGEWDEDEPPITWLVNASSPLAVTNNYYTPTNLVSLVQWFDGKTPWTTTVTEETPVDWLQTVVATGDSMTNLSEQPLSPSVDVTFDANENQERYVVFGNVPLGSVMVRKFYDRDGDGVQTAGEVLIAGWVFKLDGVTLAGDVVEQLTATSDETGHAFFDYLLPGTYHVSEVLAGAGWIGTTAPVVELDLSGGQDAVVSFGNALTSTNADFGTKGYWHNKNGLTETTPADLAYLNSLAPWTAPSSYFGNGDEPLDGSYSNGDPVDAAHGKSGELLATEGSALAEQYHFLVDSNSDPREQLAQQLDAFIMNALNRLPFGSAIWVDTGSGAGWMTTSDLIALAVLTWETGTAAEQDAIKTVLDGLNNDDNVLHIIWSP
jgi:hypothetical protein